MTTDLPPTTRLNRVLTHANTIANEYGHKELGVETLILALHTIEKTGEATSLADWAATIRETFDDDWRPDTPTAQHPSN